MLPADCAMGQSQRPLAAYPSWHDYWFSVLHDRPPLIMVVHGLDTLKRQDKTMQASLNPNERPEDRPT